MMPTRQLNTFRVHTTQANRSFEILQKWEDYHIRTRNGRTDELRDRWWYEFQGCDNLHTAFHRWFPESSRESEKKEDKKKFLDAIVQLSGSLSQSDLQACNKRLNSVLATYEKQGWKKDSLIPDGLPIQWRLVVGLGSESVLETSMTLHHVYGFPYIPASAIKGIARAYALYAEAKASHEDDLRLYPAAHIDETATKIFGTLSQAGKVIFFDAFPTEFPKLEVDVVNVHYQDYYSKGETPGDWMSPVPSFFLAVAPNTRFNFYLASRDSDLLARAKEWLYNGLTQLGIGGKTNAGYGYFSESKPIQLKAE
jgi:CRISPR-associated protein Cmr6